MTSIKSNNPSSFANDYKNQKDNTIKEIQNNKHVNAASNIAAGTAVTLVTKNAGTGYAIASGAATSAAADYGKIPAKITANVTYQVTQNQISQASAVKDTSKVLAKAVVNTYNTVSSAVVNTAKDAKDAVV